ncbi:hypothetical protein L5I01_10220 [Gordonia sp. HY442]|uniref:hypothetical protein n=1 Tax=Gordonia zhenghanii TaxID=2911516 RepID=UPI001F3BD6E2|nr:hypothetical protein [Gordonia zhenghanii]MCF8603731.1 hypothetical protein [Gordonia zhenghanii]
MSVRVVPLELEKFQTLPSHTRRCVFWEMDRADDSASNTTGSYETSSYETGLTDRRRTSVDHESEFDKEAWISGLLLEWGTCGQIAIESTTGRVVGTALYAPPVRVPRARRFPTAPVGVDAVLLSTITTEPGFEQAAVSLMDAVIADVVHRGVRAIEAFGFSGSREPLERDLVGLMLGNGMETDACLDCLMPTQFLLDSGFETVAPDLYLPRLRLELDEGLGWKSAVERALEKLVVEAAVDLSGTPAPVG